MVKNNRIENMYQVNDNQNEAEIDKIEQKSQHILVPCAA